MKKQMVLAKKLEDIDKETLKGFKAGWKWHYGKVTSLGYFTTAGGREVVIAWDEGGSSRKQGGITDGQWEIFKLAFSGSGKISVLSDKSDALDWKFDYRFLEARK